MRLGSYSSADTLPWKIGMLTSSLCKASLQHVSAESLFTIRIHIFTIINSLSYGAIAAVSTIKVPLLRFTIADPSSLAVATFLPHCSVCTCLSYKQLQELFASVCHESLVMIIMPAGTSWTS